MPNRETLGFESVTAALNAHSAKSMSENEDDILGVAIAFSKETDRGAVILAATAFEDALTKRLVQTFKPLNSTERSELFSFDRPLGSFSAKIRIGYALGILDKPGKRIAEIVRVARNACAHSRQAISFADPALMQALYFMLQELGHNGDEFGLRTKQRPDWPRFLFLMVIDALMTFVTKRRGRPSTLPFGKLAAAYVVYGATKEGWTPSKSRKRSPRKDRPNETEA